MAPRIAPPIQAPSPLVIASMLRAIESGQLTDGPAFAYDEARQVFVSAIVDDGAIVHWQLEPARDSAAAMALRDRYMQAAVLFAKAMQSEEQPLVSG